MKDGKAPGLEGVLPGVWKTNSFNEAWNKSCILLFHEKVDLKITGKYRGITLTPEQQVQNRADFDHYNNN